MAVALSAAMIVAVACAMASVHGAINRQLAMTVGAADIRLKAAVAGGTVPTRWLEEVQRWPEVNGGEAVGRLTAPLALTFTRDVLEEREGGIWLRRTTEFVSTALGESVRSDAEAAGNGAGATDRERGDQRWSLPPINFTSDLRKTTALAPPPELIAGRLPRAPDEVVIDGQLASRLSWEHHARAARGRMDGYQPFASAAYEPDLVREPAPESTTSAAEAERINRGQRPVLGDELRVVQQTLPDVEIGGFRLPSLRRTPQRTLTIVGIAAQPPLGGRPHAYLTMEGLMRLVPRPRGADRPGFSHIDIQLAPGVDPDETVARYAGTLPPELMLETTEKITSGLDKNMQSSQLGMILASVMAFLAAAFIIMTGMTTSVAQRQRELGIVRSIGGTRAQLAQSQLIIGLLIGSGGGLIGVPLGIALAYLLAIVFRDQLPTGLSVTPYAILLGMMGAVVSGVAGAAWPAWRVSRMSPLAALALRAAAPRNRGVALLTVIAAVLIALQIAIVAIPSDGQRVFWGYATVGLPAMFLGYFLLGVPVILLLSRLIAPGVSRLMGLPPRLLARSIEATPYRHGFTAGALMAGLALMVAIWTNGGAMLRDWLDKIEFPDAFVSGIALPQEAQERLEALPIVARTSAVTLHPIETDAFGVRALQQYRTFFIAFEPRPFFAMTRLAWVQGDPETALARLEQGGAVIVAREFLVAQGMGVGSRFMTRGADGTPHEFEIVGVVASPGLEVASKFFNVGETFADQAVHAIFGTRADLRDRFFGGAQGADVEPPIHLIQVQFSEAGLAMGDEQALEQIRMELLPYGILDAGSGRQIKEQITLFATGSLYVFSAIAALVLLIACLGVANLVIASIESRRFELGVLRAVGAQRGLLSRLILSETLLIALAAGVLGTLMGIQGSWAGQRLYGLLLGLSLGLHPPLLPIAAGWLVLIVLTLLAAGPAVWRLSRRSVREMLSARA
jgi:putative ABC transport system permease protein